MSTFQSMGMDEISPKNHYLAPNIIILNSAEDDDFYMYFRWRFCLKNQFSHNFDFDLCPGQYITFPGSFDKLGLAYVCSSGQFPPFSYFWRAENRGFEAEMVNFRGPNINFSLC